LKDQATFTNWDFTNVWGFITGENNGYPMLRTSALVGPYISLHPSDELVETGSTAALYVEVSGKGAGTTYQWQKKNSSGIWEDITAGGNGYSYTVPTNTSGSAGYRVVVKCADRTLESREATVTVVDNLYTVTTSVSFESYGQPPTEMYAVIDPYSAKFTNDQVFTITPGPGYLMLKLLFNGDPISYNKVVNSGITSYNVTIDSSGRLEAVFSHAMELTISSNEPSAVLKYKINLESEETYNGTPVEFAQGSDIEVSASVSGKVTQYWTWEIGTDEYNSLLQSPKVTGVQDDIDLYAHMISDQSTQVNIVYGGTPGSFDYDLGGNITGTIPFDGTSYLPVYVENAKNAVITANENSNIFQRWADSDTTSMSGFDTNAPSINAVGEDGTDVNVTAYFVPLGSGSLTLFSDPVGETFEYSFGGDEGTVYYDSILQTYRPIYLNDGENVTVIANYSGNILQRWSDNDTTAISGFDTNSTFISTIGEDGTDVNVTAYFVPSTSGYVFPSVDPVTEKIKYTINGDEGYIHSNGTYLRPLYLNDGENVILNAAENLCTFQRWVENSMGSSELNTNSVSVSITGADNVFVNIEALFTSDTNGITVETVPSLSVPKGTFFYTLGGERGYFDITRPLYGIYNATIDADTGTIVSGSDAYVFQRWYSSDLGLSTNDPIINAVDTSNSGAVVYVYLVPNNTHTLTALFTPSIYGTIEYLFDGDSIPGILYGDMLFVTFSDLVSLYAVMGPSAPSDLIFIKWDENGSSSVEPNPFVINGLTGDKTIDARHGYVITATSGSNGTITPSGDIIVEHGYPAPLFEFVSDRGYGISDVIVDGVSVGAPREYDFGSVYVGHTIHVTFVQHMYAVNITGDNGVEVTPIGKITTGYGSTIVVEFNAKLGYKISKIIVDGAEVSVAGDSYTFRNINTNHSLNIVTINVGTVELVIDNVPPGGRVEYSTDGGETFQDYTGRTPVTKGSDVILRITPAPGTEWCGSSSQSIIRIDNVQSNISYDVKKADDDYNREHSDDRNDDNNNLLIYAIVVIAVVLILIGVAAVIRRSKN